MAVQMKKVCQEISLESKTVTLGVPPSMKTPSDLQFLRKDEIHVLKVFSFWPNKVCYVGEEEIEWVF